MTNQTKMRMMTLLLTIVACGALVVGPLAPSVFATAELVFEDVWARAASEGHMSAVYMKVTNVGTSDVTIVAADADVAERVEVHETIMEVSFEGGRISQVMRMDEVEALTVESGKTVEMKPGGLHVMLIGLTRDVEEGDRFALQLQLGDGRLVELDVPVKIGLDDDDHDHHHH